MIEAELPDGRVLEFPDGTDPQVIQSTVRRLLNVQSQPEQGFDPRELPSMDSQTGEQLPVDEMGRPVDTNAQEIQPDGRNPLVSAALEGMGAVNRGVTQTADFLTTSPINAALDLAGSERRVPTITDSLSAGTAGNFMEDGLAKDVIRQGGELVGPGVAGGQALRAGAQALPRFGAASEGVRQGALRQMGASTVGQDVVQAGAAGAGSELLGQAGQEVGGETGEQLGRFAGGFLAPIGVMAGKEAVKNVSTSTAKNLLRQSAPTIDNLKRASREVYRQIDDLGATVNSDRVTGLANELRSTARQEGFNRRIHPKVAAALREFEAVKGTDQPVSNIDTLRRVANSAAQSIEPDEARLGRTLVNKVDDFLENLGPESFAGANQQRVGPLYRDARQMWQRARKAEIVQEAMTKAENQASGFENGLRTQFRSILNNKRTRRQFNKDELDAMRQVVQGGRAENLAKAIGKFGFAEDQAVRMLMPSLGVAGGAAVGGPAGAVAVPVIGQVSRSLAQKLTRNNAQMVDAIVRAGKSGQEVAKVYLRSVPSSQRSSQELAELLLRPDVSLSGLTRMKLEGDAGKLVSDAAYIVNTIKTASELDEEEANDANRTQ